MSDIPADVIVERFRSAAKTDPGAKRSHNEDTFVHRPDAGLFAVADGAGGHEAGEVASGMIRDALSAIPDELPAGRMLGEVRQRIALVHEALVEQGAERNGMIASTVVVLILRHGHFACLWVGDSRMYRLRGETLEQVTRDHSLVQELVDAGLVRPEDAESHPRANVITRAVGAGEGGPLDLDKTTDRVLPGDRFLLCSDGLSKTLPPAEIATLLAVPDPALAPDLLIAAALARKASDNVTCVVVEAAQVD